VLLLRSREYIVVKSILFFKNVSVNDSVGYSVKVACKNGVDFRFLEKYIYSILFIAVIPMVCFGELARLKSSCTASKHWMKSCSAKRAIA
jgi:hypothetical protein